jgi:hypothetical protein
LNKKLGSANGMAKVIQDESNLELFSPEIFAYIICKGQYKEVDLLELEFLSKKEKVYSFLSFTWAIIADIDIESEWY